MRKPNWNNAPEWANWVAQNRDGSWHWFEKEPEPYLGLWVSTGKRENILELGWEKILRKKPDA